MTGVLRQTRARFELPRGKKFYEIIRGRKQAAACRAQRNRRFRIQILVGDFYFVFSFSYLFERARKNRKLTRRSHRTEMAVKIRAPYTEDAFG